MQRLLTALVALPLALAAVFVLPAGWFFALVLVLLVLAALEYVSLGRRWAPRGPLWVLPVLVPPAAWALGPGLPGGPAQVPLLVHELLLAAAVLSVGVGVVVLLARTPVEEGMAALGILAFGLPYLALPAASLYHLQLADPWLLLLVLAVVWLGDTAAYYVGSAWGRRRLAPRVSPKKTWEGAAANLAASLLAAVAWSFLHLGRPSARVLALAAAASVAGQLGDLVESIVKRGAGVKDSGGLLPGHGGFLDRLDALLFAAPVFLFGVWWLGGELAVGS